MTDTTTTQGNTYHIGSGSQYPNSVAGFAECVIDDLQYNTCFSGYCAADPKHKTEALLRIESCPIAASMVEPFQSKATADVPMFDTADAKGYKPIAQRLLGLRTTTLEKTLQTTINVMRVGAMLASVISPNKPESCISSEVVGVGSFREAVDKNTTGIFLWKGVYIVLFYGKTKMIPFLKN